MKRARRVGAEMSMNYPDAFLTPIALALDAARLDALESAAALFDRKAAALRSKTTYSTTRGVMDDAATDRAYAAANEAVAAEIRNIKPEKLK